MWISASADASEAGAEKARRRRGEGAEKARRRRGEGAEKARLEEEKARRRRGEGAAGGGGGGCGGEPAGVPVLWLPAAAGLLAELGQRPGGHQLHPAALRFL
ncbi:hypothetical protein SUZIE_122525 [Sciurus carolinensis]|uniref:Uncharacterized protein n=1 Tax=Sciurus carolinensis TaxID=30640 RepID=A0AA41MK16_SCICA|nr:hypothetical protein [Sciurus carolinensis]